MASSSPRAVAASPSVHLDVPIASRPRRSPVTAAARGVALLAVTSALAACGANATTATPPPGDGGAAADGGTTPTAGELPPTGDAKALEAWLATGDYKSWSCEPAPHGSRSPSPHGTNRICSNTLVSRFQGATAPSPRPKGSAAVKELYTDDGKTILGYAVEEKVADESAGGAGWYWYERMGTTVAADGLGNDGTPKSICVGCHTAAGSDAAHTPTPGGGDFVYTAVR